MAKKNNVPSGAQPKDKRLGRMVMLSGLVHAGVLVFFVSAADRTQSKPQVLPTYTVDLVAPAALGLPPAPQPVPRPKQTEPTAVPQPPKPAPPATKKEVKQPKVETTEKKKQPKAISVQSKEKKALKISSKKKPPVQKKEPLKTATKKSPPKKPKKQKKQKKIDAKREVKDHARKPTPPKPAPPKEMADNEADAEERDQQILAALDKIRQRLKSEPKSRAKPIETEAGQTGEQTGRQGGGGEAVHGLPFLLYTDEVKRQVKNSWIVAEQKSGLTAIVRFGILASGEVIDLELAERSGDYIFDESAIRAVKKASPLPPPPEAYQDEFARQKVEIVFGESRDRQ